MVSVHRMQRILLRVIPDGRAGRVNVLLPKFPKCSLRKVFSSLNTFIQYKKKKKSHRHCLLHPNPSVFLPTRFPEASQCLLNLGTLFNKCPDCSPYSIVLRDSSRPGLPLCFRYSIKGISTGLGANIIPRGTFPGPHTTCLEHLPRFPDGKPSPHLLITFHAIYHNS